MARFIKASSTGRRRKADGNRLRVGTINGYTNCRRLIVEFLKSSNTTLDICTRIQINKSEFRQRKLYWRRFCRKFADFLYASGHFDNYISHIFKIIQTLLHYLRDEYGWQDYQFLHHAYNRQEVIPVVSLTIDQFRFLLHDKEFRSRLKPNQAIVLDIFLFGCITTLRVSDLFGIREKNLFKNGEKTWLALSSRKTGIKTNLLLPPPAMEIFNRYKLSKGRLLPTVSIVNLNIQIKKLGELAGWTHSVSKFRNKRGIPKQCSRSNDNASFRFCDLLTTHTMRRTGISLLLMSGMPEHLVRQISGHKPGSREFYRYVNLHQNWQDQYSEAAFNIL